MENTCTTETMGPWTRAARALGGVMALTCSLMAPLPPAVRLSAFGATGIYLLLSALTGRCAMARMLGRFGRRSGSEP